MFSVAVAIRSALQFGTDVSIGCKSGWQVSAAYCINGGCAEQDGLSMDFQRLLEPERAAQTHASAIEQPAFSLPLCIRCIILLATRA